MRDCLNVGGGGMVPGLTARKFGMTPRIRLGCCFVGSTLPSWTDWLGASGRFDGVEAAGDVVSGLDDDPAAVGCPPPAVGAGVEVGSRCWVKAAAGNENRTNHRRSRKKILYFFGRNLDWRYSHPNLFLNSKPTGDLQGCVTH